MPRAESSTSRVRTLPETFPSGRELLAVSCLWFACPAGLSLWTALSSNPEQPSRPLRQAVYREAGAVQHLLWLLKCT